MLYKQNHIFPSFILDAEKVRAIVFFIFYCS